MDTNELNPSELGTKSYWDKSYNTEIKNYLNHGDTGDVWFDESSQFRVIKWMNASTSGINKGDSIIDLGTGNGMMLIELSLEGYTNLTGIDYSENGIELAQKIAKDQNHTINYKVADLLSDALEVLGKFKVCHDKGTYDAISLMENAMEKRSIYMKNVANLMNDDGLFIITSCNFTEDELIESFNEVFVKEALIPTQTFRFGGKIGSVVTSIVLKKK
ncbi:CLUMA_CG001507, isoform A, partial [Clunio marinus]